MAVLPSCGGGAASSGGEWRRGLRGLRRSQKGFPGAVQGVLAGNQAALGVTPHLLPVCQLRECPHCPVSSASMCTVVPSAQTARDLGFSVAGLYCKLWGWDREDRCLHSLLGYLLLPLLSARPSACYLRFIDFLSLGYFSVFLGKIKDAFDRNPGLQNLLLDDFFKSAMENCQVCSPELGGVGVSSQWVLL